MKSWSGALGFGMVLLLAGQADALVIDTFDRVANANPQGADIQIGIGSTRFELPGPRPEIEEFGPVGASRTLTIISGFSTANLAVFNGQLGFSAGPFLPAIAEVRWDGDGSGLGGVDLTVDNPNGLLSFSVEFVDTSAGAAADLSMTLTDVQGQFASLSTSITESDLTGLPSGEDMLDVVFELSDFGGVDIRRIDEIRLQLSGNAGTDILLAQSGAPGGPALATVATPATLALLALGLATLAVTARRRLTCPLPR